MKRRPFTEQEQQLILDLAALRLALHFETTKESFEAWHRLHDFVWATIPETEEGDSA